MSTRDETRQTRRMMLLSVITVLCVVAAVIAGFLFVHRNDQQEASAATDVDKVSKTTQYQPESGKTEGTGSGTAAGGGVSGSGTVEAPSESAQKGRPAGDPEGSAQELYLVEGNEKSPSPYGKVDHISYSNTEVYTDGLLEKLQLDGLRITRNEIFARHGRMFNDQGLQDYFNLQGWYTARYSPESFDDSCLNQVERENVEKIMEYEQDMSSRQDNSTQDSSGQE